MPDDQVGEDEVKQFVPIRLAALTALGLRSYSLLTAWTRLHRREGAGWT